MRFRCPHCGTSSVVRTSQIMSRTLSFLYVQCRNLECGHTWRVDAEASVTISPSAQPNPTVEMPISPYVNRNLLALQLETARVGHHQPPGPHQPDLDGLQDGDRAPQPDLAPALTRP